MTGVALSVGHAPAGIYIILVLPTWIAAVATAVSSLVILGTLVAALLNLQAFKRAER